MKITIDQLKNYLGAGLKIQITEYYPQSTITTIDSIDAMSEELISFKGSPDWYFETSENDIDFKPICYRLSDLDKFIPELGFVPLQELYPRWTWNKEKVAEQWYVELSKQGHLLMRAACHQNVHGPTLSYPELQKLFQWHFWPFGEEYFEAGLVIDKMLSSN